MIKLPILLAAAVSMAGAASVTPDQKALLDYLSRSEREFNAAVKGLSSAQWEFKAGADRWSVAECAEHIALSESFVRDLIDKVLATPESAPSADASAADQKIQAMITDRSFKAKAPEPLAPKRNFAKPSEAVKRFKAERAKTVALVKSRSDWRSHKMQHPIGQELDAHQWMLFLSGHTLRHTAQIREVKSSDGFPK